MSEGEFWLIKTEAIRANAAAAVMAAPINPKKPYCIKIQEQREKRSDAQNRLSHIWYREISKQGQEYTPSGVLALCKYQFGLPIMRSDHTYMKYWNLARMDELNHEALITMLEVYPMTRLMDAKQMTEYLDTLQKVMSRKYQLTDPSLCGL